MSQTVRTLLEQGAELLCPHHPEHPRLEAELLLSHVTNLKRLEFCLDPEKKINPDAVAAFFVLIHQRTDKGTPIQYLTGYAPFRNLDLKIAPEVLIPRPETEQLVEHALNILKYKSAPAILDLCSGSGAIALSIADELQNATVFASDCSAEALLIANENAKKHHLAITFFHGDLFNPIPKNLKFDLIISNPPYISWSDYQILPEEVRNFEPDIALTDFSDGLTLIRHIVRQAPHYLKSNGILMLEIGETQGQPILEMMIHAGFTHAQVLNDLAGRPRFIISGENHNLFHTSCG